MFSPLTKGTGIVQERFDLPKFFSCIIKIAMSQLNLRFSNDTDALKHYFERATGKAVSLTITDNSTTMLSVRTKGNSVFVRLHWMFLNASNDVIRAIAEFIQRRKDKTPLNRVCP